MVVSEDVVNIWVECSSFIFSELVLSFELWGLGSSVRGVSVWASLLVPVSNDVVVIWLVDTSWPASMGLKGECLIIGVAMLVVLNPK